MPSTEDIKVPIIEFFQTAGQNKNAPEEPAVERPARNILRHTPAQELLTTLLTQAGYIVRPMDVIWKNGLSVEHPTSDMRAALMVDCAEGSVQEWQTSYRQQKAIERVGWKCFRVDYLSLLTDHSGTLASVCHFLSAAGVEPPAILYDELDEEYGETVEDGNEQAPIVVDDNEVNGAPADDAVAAVGVNDDQEDDGDAESEQQQGANGQAEAEDEVIVISSEDEDDMDSKPRAKVKPEPVASGSFGDESSDGIDETNFGDVVDLAFLRSGQNAASAAASLDDSASLDDGDSHQADAGDTASQRAAQRRRRRLDKYQRDGRWHPKRDGDEHDDQDPEGHDQDWYDVEETERNQKRQRSEEEAYMPENDEMSDSN